MTPDNRIKFRFGVKEWVDKNGKEGFALKHCMECQPMSDPEIKRDIEHLRWRFKFMAVTTGLCDECAEIRMKELDDWMKKNNI